MATANEVRAALDSLDLARAELAAKQAAYVASEGDAGALCVPEQEAFDAAGVVLTVVLEAARVTVGTLAARAEYELASAGFQVALETMRVVAATYDGS